MGDDLAELAHPARIRDLLLTKADSGDGQSFHVVSERAITLRGYAEAVAAWFGQQAKVRYLPFSEFRRMTLAEHAELTWAHSARSASMSIDRPRRLLGYRPRYTSLQAIADAVATASWRSQHRARRTHRLTPPHRDRQAILEGVGSSRHCPRVQTMDAVAHARAPWPIAVLRWPGRMDHGSACAAGSSPPPPGLTCRNRLYWTLCEARIRPDDSFINLIPSRVQARGVNVW
jgi:hypothetical protein